jgi:hypothetical protein
MEKPVKTFIYLSSSKRLCELEMFDGSILELKSINQDDVRTYAVIK